MDFQYPAARLPTIVTSGVIHQLPFSVPLEPTAAGAVDTLQAIPSPAVLSAVAAALQHTDAGHVRLRLPPSSFAPEPGTLEYAVVAIHQHAFAQAARPTPAAAQMVASGQPGQVQQQQQAASPAKVLPATRPLPAAEKQEPAAKRRKKAVATDEEFVARTVNVQQVAEEVAAAISSFLAKASSADDDDAEEEDTAAVSSDDEDNEQQQQPGAAARQRQKLPMAHITLQMLKELHANLSSGKQAGITSQLNEEQLRQLLLLLLGHVRLGDNKLLDEQDTASSSTGKMVLTSLEAACCCMQLLAAPGLPNSLYMDELMTATVSLAKYQLQFNVLAFHDPQYRRLYRPSSAGTDGEAAATGKKRGRADSAGVRVPRVVGDVCAKLELLLSLLAQVVGHVLLEVELLLPLVRVSLTCLGVDCLQLLQAEAIVLAVAVFRGYPQQRPSLMEEVLSTVIANITVAGSRGPARLFEAMDAASRLLPIQMATVLVMQLVQASVQLPDMDADPETIETGFRGAYGFSDLFWKGVFGRLPAAKAAKSDGAADFKAVMEALLADLLAVQMLPEWPVATILLRRFLKCLSSNQGLHHPDAHVKLAAVEFTGQLVGRLCAEAVVAESEAGALQAVMDTAEAAADPALLQSGNHSEQVLHALLLDYLAAADGSSSSSSNNSNSSMAAARRFVCYRMLNDAIMRHRGAKLTKEQLSLLLVQHRQLQDSQHPVLGPGLSQLVLRRGQYVSLTRWWVMQGLGAGRATLIKWLVDAGRLGPDANPATVRTKVFKCLGSVVESDARVLALPEVAAAVRAALDDDSVAVREASLELLAKLIATHPALASEYFDVLVKASHDAGVSVRKRAIRSLWECCTCPGFTRAAEAVVAVLQRAGDNEESMRGLVTKICGEMWFTEGSSFAGLSEAGPSSNAPSAASKGTRSAAVRARELAEVSLKVYEAGGKAIHVPLTSDHPLIVILKEVLGAGSSSGGAATGAAAKEQVLLRAGASEVATALLDLALQHQQDQPEEGADQTRSSNDAFPYLLALHALCAADASLATPREDPQRFVRCLAPYIAATCAQQGILARSNSGTSGALNSEDLARRAAEECLCLLAVLKALLLVLGVVELEVMQQMSHDLLALINKQRYLQLVAAGCELLCTLAPLHTPVTANISQLATKCYNLALGALGTMRQEGPTPISPAQLYAAPKVLYILGQLCRHGASLIDAAAAENPSMRNCTECLELCVALWYRPDMPDSPAGQRIRDAALQALGMMVIGKPQLMLQPLQLTLLSDQAAADGDGTAARVSDRGSPDNTGIAASGGGGAAGAAGIAKCAAEVYAAALSGQSPVAVRTRVLTNLVELLRSEEAALMSAQKDAEAASTTSRLASTMPSESKAPLSKVNGEADAAVATSSSSIVQRVWKDVLRLATGVAGSTGGAAGLATPGAAAGAAGEAAVMRRRALELIEVVLRGGLVGPWTAVAPLVAQLTDEVPDTRQAALKVLKGACEKYPDYVGNQLAPGVMEAFQFQSRLWAAKHPNQPLPKTPKPEVLEGLASMYQQVIATNINPRSRFLQNLLKPFGTACSLADMATAAKEDVHKLAFCAYVAAALPFKKADEPLVLIHGINCHVSRQAQEVLASLRRQLLKLGLKQHMGLGDAEEEEEEEADEAAGQLGGSNAAQQQQDGQQQQQDGQQQENGASGSSSHGQQQQQKNVGMQQPLGQEVLAPLKASLALSMLLVLKQYLMAAYGLSDERVAAFELKGERYRHEAKALVSKDKKLAEFGLAVVNLRCLQDATGQLMGEQYKTFRGLLDNDAANYREAAVLAALEDHEDDDDAGIDASHVGATPAAAAAAAAAANKAGHAGTAGQPGLVVYSMDTKKGAKSKSAAKSTGKAAGRGGSTGGGRGRGGTSMKRKGGKGSTAAKGKGRKRRKSNDTGSEDSDDEDWGAPPKRELF